MIPAFTIILPHLRNPGNDRALDITLNTLLANTVHEFALLMEAVRDGVLYETVNRMVGQVRTEYFVYWSSDMFPAPAWEVPMLALAHPMTIVTNVVVEPGAIGVCPQSVHKDFGRKPDTYQREAFEAWTASDEAPVPDGFGWYCPYLMHTASFVAMGGLQTGLTPDHQGFSGADELMFERWQAAGKSIQRAKSYVYHLQRYSQVDEQEHEKREVTA